MADRKILLVGSVPLGAAAEVFATVARELDGHIARIPDGETGERTNWIAWQRALLAGHPKLEQLPPDPQVRIPVFKLRAGAAGPVEFGALGYAKAALESWRVFNDLQASGRIPPGTRFQVSLPTPLAVVAQYLVPEAQAAAEAGYKARLIEELNEILAGVPHDRLAIQWDVAIEFMILEGLKRAHFAEPRDGVIVRLVEACDAVAADVEMGLHLCYGDAGHKHFKEPDDTRLMVEVANAVNAGAHRRIDWIHMPVPRGRDDNGYFAPLADLKLDPVTELYLGLIHYSDGIEGARRRIAAARKARPEFGIATECGFGRRPADTVPKLLRLHLEASRL